MKQSFLIDQQFWNIKIAFYISFPAKIGNTNDASARKAVSYVVSKCYVGDWFVLYQISKNVNMYFFRVFIKELRKDMKLNPKKQNLPKVLGKFLF